MRMQRPPPRTVAVLAALVAAAGLAFAHALEIWGEMVPCALCLLERWPYRIVIVLGLLAALAPTRLVRIHPAGGGPVPAGRCRDCVCACWRGDGMVAEPLAGMRRASSQQRLDRRTAGLHARTSRQAVR